MSDLTPTPQFEEEIRAAIAVPLANEQFLKSLHYRIIQQAESQQKIYRPFFLRPAWVVFFTVIVAIIVVALSVGPQRVIAAVRGLFGYIPGVGIVDQSLPIRVLAEPVTITRDGISITVTSATLTGRTTYIEYRVFGVPSSAYPNQEDVTGCTTPEYIRLPDGTRLERSDNSFAPFPAGMDTATFVIPCIFNTLPGKTPDTWELPLRFTPAPPDLTPWPVIELSPSHQTNPTSETNSDNPPVTPTADAVTVSKVIETREGYILTGRFQPHLQPGENIQLTGPAVIRDASGMEVSYTIPQDIQTDAENFNQVGSGWAYQFKAAGLTYPLSITFPGVQIIQADPAATAEFTFDAGPNPQPGQEWQSDQEVQLAGYVLNVVSISVVSGQGYSFVFQVDPKVFRLDLQILGHTPIGGGGGGGGGLTDGLFYASQSFAEHPTGVLTVKLSNLAIIGDPITWQGLWTPEKPRTDLPTQLTPQTGICLTSETLSYLKLAPSNLANGNALVYDKFETGGAWGLALYSLDGSQKQIVTMNGNWGALSPDGSQVAYSAIDNSIHLVDVDSMTDYSIPNTSGFDIKWSPDGTQIAYIGMGNGAINSTFIAKVDGSHVRQVSNLSYETIIGWSPDSTVLYFSTPYTGGASWKVYAYSIYNGTTQEQFTIENGTPKFLNPGISPDGQWISYRGRDNSSLYLVHPDGTGMHLVLENLGVVRNVWSASGWIGASLRQANTDYREILLIKPDSCEAYLLPIALQGDLEGIFLP